MMKLPLSSSLRNLAVFLMSALLLSTAGVSLVRWVDIHYAGEALKDSWGRWRFHEDWGKVAPLHAGQDYRWVSNPLLVAHALGGAGSVEENTLASMDKSLALGLKVLEIDVWLDQDGQLRCHHGPGNPGPLKAGDCTWQKAFAKASAADAWLILDLKTDFQTTAQALLHGLPHANAARNIIFQLYKPEHVALFAQWQKQYPLPGPLITAYAAKRSLQHIADNVQRIGVEVLTLPLYRRAALKRDGSRLNLLVHPVGNCADVQSSAPASGYYVTAATARLIRQECSAQGRD